MSNLVSNIYIIVATTSSILSDDERRFSRNDTLYNMSVNESKDNPIFSQYGFIFRLVLGLVHLRTHIRKSKEDFI